MKYKKSHEEDYTLIDRIAVAFLAGLLAFVTGILLCVFLAGFTTSAGQSIIIPSYRWIVGFTLIMAVLGFFKLENYLVNFYGYIWNLLYQIFRY